MLFLLGRQELLEYPYNLYPRKFTYTNEQAEELGFFRANEQLVTAGFGKQLYKKWSIGAALSFYFLI